MKISIIGLNACGKTSIYLTTLGGMAPNEVKDLDSTVLYEVWNHYYLGLQISLWDFGGQEKYRSSCLETPKLLVNSTILICVLDLHCPQDFNKARSYFEDVYFSIKQNGGDPRLYIFYHKYDTKDYPKKQLEKNLALAKALFNSSVLKPKSYLTSIYRQEELNEILRQILIADFKQLKKNFEQVRKRLLNLPSDIIICDMNGNVITHNIKWFTTGMQLEEDLRDYVFGCNMLSHYFFSTKSTSFSAKSHEKKLDLYVLNHVLTVLIITYEDTPVDPSEGIKDLLKEVQIFADVIPLLVAQT
ncbi:MAG: hypothetical protein JSW11_07135 [Candidatus Heimdallarchaeota archaeon]|nr:MAG: hypothetical protein JSW11_07135 [Candidatus Heimdallarchaeota archaeon]